MHACWLASQKMDACMCVYTDVCIDIFLYTQMHTYIINAVFLIKVPLE